MNELNILLPPKAADNFSDILYFWTLALQNILMKVTLLLYFKISLAVFSAGVYAGEYQLTLYTIPAKTQIDFSTPRSMAWTAFGNALTMHLSQRKHAMGHVYIELAGPEFSTYAESSKERMFASSGKVLREGYGLGILFKGIEGKIAHNKVVTQDLPVQYHNGGVAFIKALINEEIFNRLVYYLEEYQQRGYGKIYNGLNRPREGLGAGCTAFGMSFFEVAGIVQPEWEENWAESVRVPYQLIGGPLTGNYVPLEEVFTAKEWASPEELHMVFRIIDPYLIFKWIQEQYELLSAIQADHSTLDGHMVIPSERGKARGLIYDFRSYPVPDEPVFLIPENDLKQLLSMPERKTTQ